MKKLLLAAALVVASAGAQAQEMHRDTKSLLSLCMAEEMNPSADKAALEKADMLCFGMLAGFKMGYAQGRSEYKGYKEYEKVSHNARRINVSDMKSEMFILVGEKPELLQYPPDFIIKEALTRLGIGNEIAKSKRK